MASLPDMNSCWKTPRLSYWALQLWLLCVLSSLQLSWTALSWNQCFSEGFAITDIVGIFGLMPNLTVMCERDVAHLNSSTGGNIVDSLRAAQECTVLSTNETIIFDQDRYYQEMTHIVSTSKEHNQWSFSPPHLQDSDIECHYFGCYYIDKDDEKYYDVDYDDIIDIVILPNATCTFSQLATSISSSVTPSNSSLSLSSSSFLTASPTESSTLPIVATSVRKAPSEVISTHKPTHHTSRFTVQGSQTVTESRKSPTSISTISSHSISTVPSQPSSGNVKSEWIILIALMIALLVISVITFISCLLFTSKRYFNSSIKQGIHDPNEPRDKGFTGELPNNGHIGSGHFVLVVPYRSGDKVNP